MVTVTQAENFKQMNVGEKRARTVHVYAVYSDVYSSGTYVDTFCFTYTQHTPTLINYASFMSVACLWSRSTPLSCPRGKYEATASSWWAWRAIKTGNRGGTAYAMKWNTMKWTGPAVRPSLQAPPNWAGTTGRPLVKLSSVTHTHRYPTGRS